MSYNGSNHAPIYTVGAYRPDDNFPLNEKSRSLYIPAWEALTTVEGSAEANDGVDSQRVQVYVYSNFSLWHSPFLLYF